MSNFDNSFEKLRADVVVIGGGGAGLAAAVEAGERTGSVILLEKLGKPGGNAKFVEGIFAAESPLQKRMNLAAPRDELFRIAMDFAHWRINPRIFRAFVDKSGDTISWLEERGLHFDRVRSFYPGQKYIVWHSSGEKIGEPLIKTLTGYCEKLGVEICCRAPARKLLTDENGKLTGVLAKISGKDVEIEAKSIVIAAGGYGGNKRLLKKYFPYYSENLVNRGFAHMGDGLQMAMEIGAATEGLGTIISMGPLFPWSTSLTLLARRPNTVWVNNRGERFFDEGDVNVAYLGNAMDRQPEQTSYSLFDERIKQDFINQERSYLEDLMGDSKKRPNTIDEDLEAQVQKGRVKIAGSWEEIGQWIGAAHGVIESTIDEYNAAGDRGYDALFVKEREFLIPLRVPPYYAIKCQRGFDTTVGGVKINHRMEVLDKSDEPIPGLFAAGTNTGGWEADTYNYRLSGTAIGFAVNSGRIAGENAAEYVLKSK